MHDLLLPELLDLVQALVQQALFFSTIRVKQLLKKLFFKVHGHPNTLPNHGMEGMKSSLLPRIHYS